MGRVGKPVHPLSLLEVLHSVFDPVPSLSRSEGDSRPELGGSFQVEPVRTDAAIAIAFEVVTDRTDPDENVIRCDGSRRSGDSAAVICGHHVRNSKEQYREIFISD